MAEAKAAVPEPAQPKVTLRMSAKDPEPTKLKLHLTSKSGNTETGGVIVDSAALKRQQELVAAGANGQTKPAKDAADVTQSPATTAKDQDTLVSGHDSMLPITNGVNPEARALKSPGPSPALAKDASDISGESIVAAQAGPMLPPSGTTPRVPSASPHPQTTQRSTTPHVIANPLDNRFRPAGKGTTLSKGNVSFTEANFA